MKIQKIYSHGIVAPCYFRTTACSPHRKAMLQITEQCNLHCRHCFVSSKQEGTIMRFEIIKNNILPRLLDLNVIKITLTGGEPFTHPNLLDICNLLSEQGIEITICTNGTLVSKEKLLLFTEIPKLKFNISLDGFSFNSHGKFRGIKTSSDFEELLSNIKDIGKIGKLNGLLCTPNMLCDEKEFEEICQFGKDNNAKYVLFNPLSKSGRGQKSFDLAVNEKIFEKIEKQTRRFIDEKFEVLYIRFPNIKKQALPKCTLGNMFYVFANGDTTLCPYMVFACKNNDSPYPSNQFIVGNIITDDLNIDEYLNKNKLNNIALKTKCKKANCSGGCYAAKIMDGNKINDCDNKLCPNKFVQNINNTKE